MRTVKTEFWLLRAHVLFPLIGIVCLFNSMPGFAQQTDSGKQADEKPPILAELENRTDDLGFSNLMETSAVEAEKFRRTLLAESKRGALTLGVACVSFRDSKQVAELAVDSSYDLTRFRLSHLEIADAIVGTRPVPVPADFYGSFEGKWFGLWEKQPVDHHWGGFHELNPPKTFEVTGGPPVTLLGYQYAWVGDGYGLNHLAQSSDGKQKFLLGYVVHLKNRDLGQEVTRRPHVGVIDGQDRLIWITKSEVFFEEMIRGAQRQSDRYYITGFRYSIKENILDASQAFQAVYTRDSSNRIPWRGFDVELNVAPPKSMLGN